MRPQILPSLLAVFSIVSPVRAEPGYTMLQGGNKANVIYVQCTETGPFYIPALVNTETELDVQTVPLQHALNVVNGLANASDERPAVKLDKDVLEKLGVFAVSFCAPR